MLYILETINNSETSINTEVVHFRKENSENIFILLLHAWIQVQINFLPHTFLSDKYEYRYNHWANFYIYVNLTKALLF